MRFRSFTIAAALLLLVLAADVQAVPPYPALQSNSLNVTSGSARYSPQRPTISPYLLLAPSGSGTFGTINYYTLVRPQFQQQAINAQQGVALQQLESQIRSPNANVDPVTGQPVIRTTGARSGYMTHHRYFGNSYRGPSNSPPLR